jgi:hypothetical protein
MKLIIALVLASAPFMASATCLGTYVQCNAYTQQQYGQSYQQYEQNQQPQWNQPQFPNQQYAPPVNQHGFDRYGHYHASY